ncbi:MAG TPA: porin family protein [Chitinophagaceae bacterium]
MKMKIVFFAFTAMFVSMIAIGQKSGVILKAGVNLANVSINDEGNIDEAKSLTSFQAGVIGDIYVAPFLSFQPGVVFSGKGTKTQSGSVDDPSYYRATTNPYYIEIPANLVFKTPTGSTRFFAGAGPYLGIGIAGKNKVDGKIFGTSFHSEENIEWSNDDPTTLDFEEGAGLGVMKRFDYGINGLAGIEFSKAVLSVNYGFGLAKLQSGSTSSSDNNNKHRVWGFTLGVKL